MSWGSSSRHHGCFITKSWSSMTWTDVGYYHVLIRWGNLHLGYRDFIAVGNTNRQGHHKKDESRLSWESSFRNGKYEKMQQICERSKQWSSIWELNRQSFVNTCREGWPPLNHGQLVGTAVAPCGYRVPSNSIKHIRKLESRERER